jgi:chromosome segregation ATPase
MSEGEAHSLHANRGAIEFPSGLTQQAQSIVAACALLRQQLQDTAEKIKERQQYIQHNKQYIAQRQLPLLEKELKDLRTMAKSLPPNHPAQEKISELTKTNEELIKAISDAPNGILPDVKAAEEAKLALEQDLQVLQQEFLALQQELESKRAELQTLNLNGANVHIPWLFFQNTPPTGDEEADEPIPTTFRTLNRGYNDRY